MKSTEKTTLKRGRPSGKSRSEFQCISFLTTPGLLERLKSLKKSGKIGHYWFVLHEPDEDTKKAHHHLRMTPPLSRAVDWSDIVDEIVEDVPGESLKRRLVASSRAVNNESLEGLLYARHDSRYCAVKGLEKKRYDYSRDDFVTDDDDWLDELWNSADNYTPSRRRLGTEELLEEVERNPGISRRALLRLCLLNGATKGTMDMLDEYRRELIATEKPNIIAEQGNDNEKESIPYAEIDPQLDLPGFSGPSWDV